MTMTRPALNDPPEQRLLSWGVTYPGPQHKGQRCIDISVWVPAELVEWERNHYWEVRKLTRLADYLHEHLGFRVCTSIGWGSSLENDGLILIGVAVGAREVKAALARGPR